MGLWDLKQPTARVWCLLHFMLEIFKCNISTCKKKVYGNGANTCNTTEQAEAWCRVSFVAISESFSWKGWDWDCHGDGLVKLPSPWLNSNNRTEGCSVTNDFFHKLIGYWLSLWQRAQYIFQWYVLCTFNQTLSLLRPFRHSVSMHRPYLQTNFNFFSQCPLRERGLDQRDAPATQSPSFRAHLVGLLPYARHNSEVLRKVFRYNTADSLPFQLFWTLQLWNQTESYLILFSKKCTFLRQNV